MFNVRRLGEDIHVVGIGPMIGREACISRFNRSNYTIVLWPSLHSTKMVQGEFTAIEAAKMLLAESP